MKIGSPRWNGKKISRREFLRRKIKGAAPSGTPMINDAYAKNALESMGAGVHPGQVQEFNQMYADAGITGAYHKPDGKLVMETKKDRNAVFKLREIRDNDAGYGDYAGKH